MLEKTFYKSLLSRSFNIPVKVVYWDGKSAVYGDGEPEVTITFKEKILSVMLRRTPPLPLGKPTWTARSKLMAVFKN